MNQSMRTCPGPQICLNTFVQSSGIYDEADGHQELLAHCFVSWCFKMETVLRQAAAGWNWRNQSASSFHNHSCRVRFSRSGEACTRQWSDECVCSAGFRKQTALSLGTVLRHSGRIHVGIIFISLQLWVHIVQSFVSAANSNTNLILWFRCDWKTFSNFRFEETCHISGCWCICVHVFLNDRFLGTDHDPQFDFERLKF